MNDQKSRDFFQKVRERIPLGSQTFSKSYLQFIDAGPRFIERGKGSHVWDIDGNEYIDMVGALLPIVLGYCYEPVDSAIRRQLEKGITFSLPSPLEYELAKKLSEIIPCAEMVRFGKNGSDATSGAIRLARALTRRERIAVCGYHGWQDWYIAVNPRNEGIPESVKRLTHRFHYNDINSLTKLLSEHPGQFAAVIMEPMHAEEPANGFLDEVKDAAHGHGALLIFDEIITGFRFHIGGAQSLFGVVPDLATFGKSMANGMPISAVVGKAAYMKKMEDIFFSFTFGGECLSLAAALETIRQIEEHDVIPYLWNAGDYVKSSLRHQLRANNLEQIITLCGKPCMQTLQIRDSDPYTSAEIKSFIQQNMLENGILWMGAHNWSFSHSRADQDRLISVYQTSFSTLRRALDSRTLEIELKYRPIPGNYTVRAA